MENERFVAPNRALRVVRSPFRSAMAEYDFQVVDAEASMTYQQQAGSLRKGSYATRGCWSI